MQKITPIKFIHLLLLLSLCFSCTPEEEMGTARALKEYDIWRNTQMETSKYSTDCSETSSKMPTNSYLLPTLAQLGNKEIAFIDTSSFYFNEDKHPDLLVKLIPENCQPDTSLLDKHPPVYLLITSNEEGYELIDTIDTTVQGMIKETIKDFNPFYQWVRIDTLHKEGKEIFVQGTFSAWHASDKFGSPSINGIYQVLMPNEESAGATKTKGTFKHEDIDLVSEFAINNGDDLKALNLMLEQLRGVAIN